MPGELRICAVDRLDEEPIVRDCWTDFVRRRDDVYHDLRYLKTVSAGERGEIFLALYTCPHGSVIYAFVKRRLDALPFHTDDAGRFDIITPYEFGGPLVHADGDRDAEAVRAEFNEAFTEYCRAECIVSEIVRFDPLLGNQEGWEGYYDFHVRAQHVVIHLDRSEEAIFSGYGRRRRRSVRLAARRGVTVERVDNTPESIMLFTDIYFATMDRLAAKPYYYFTPAYFEGFATLPEDLASLYLARAPEGKAVAAALFLHGARNAYYHLGGSLREYARLCANSMLFHKAALEMKTKGRRYLQLGGAAVGQEGLYSFKAGFSEDRIRYVVGRRIHDAVAYEKLAAAWAEHHRVRTSDAGGGYFPIYRREFESPPDSRRGPADGGRKPRAAG